MAGKEGILFSMAQAWLVSAYAARKVIAGASGCTDLLNPEPSAISPPVTPFPA